MKRKPPMAKLVSPLLKACGNLANEAGLTEERYFNAGDLEAGSVSGWFAQLNDNLKVELDAVVGEDEHGNSASERVGNPLRAIWSVTVWATSDDGAASPIVDVRNLPFADALRIASALIQTHKFKRVANGPALV